MKNARPSAEASAQRYHSNSVGSLGQSLHEQRLGKALTVTSRRPTLSTIGTALQESSSLGLHYNHSMRRLPPTYHQHQFTITQSQHR